MGVSSELLNRLAEAEAGSRELDLWVEGVVSGGSGRLVGTTRDVPVYTTSLDAALALAERVLPDHDWSVGCLPVSDDADYEDHHSFGALLYAHSRVASREDGLGHGATPALALCIAILKAKEASDA